MQYKIKIHLRQSIIVRFPYLIYYTIREELKQVIIVGILHSSRNPEIVKKELCKISKSVQKLFQSN